VRYERPPITEALVELHFKETRPDHGVGGRFYEAWKDRCTKREQIQIQRFQVAIGPMPPLSDPPLPSDRLWLEGPLRVVQVGPRYLAVHVLQPYPGFDAFLPRLKEALEHYSALVQPDALERIAMRYINRLRIPVGEDGALAPWLSVGLLLPDSFAGRLSGFNLRTSVEFPEAGSDLQYVFRNGTHGDGAFEVWLDLQVTSKPSQPPRLDDLDGWLATSHDQGIIEAFEGSITATARQAFGVLDE